MLARDRWKLLAVAVVVVACHVFDLVATYIGTPDLSDEGNQIWLFLIRHGINVGWPGVIGGK